jgi:hypothetical protein
VSKKSFTDGLDSLFSGGSSRESLDTLAPPKRKGKRPAGKKSFDLDLSPEDSESKKHAGKSFALDLDLFLEEVLHDSLMAELEKDQANPESPPPESPTDRRGLDSLIRSTLETSEIEVLSGKTKRVTFFFDERKIALLKAIAKNEKLYMREIISRIVAEYLHNNYPEDNIG